MKGCVLLVMINLVSACDAGDGCPRNTALHVVRNETGTTRSCVSADGKLEGDRVELDLDGNEIAREHYHDGKLDGPGWRIRKDAPFAGERVEVEWRAGQPHGKSRRWSPTGELAEDCFVDDLHVVGPCLRNGDYREIVGGRRAGFWRVHQLHDEIRIYGGDGVLLAVDGHPLPLPPASITVGDEVVQRDRCPPAYTRKGSACADLFEDYQRCTLKPDAKHAHCRQIARNLYGMFGDLP